MLDREYIRLQELAKEMIASCSSYSLVTDGWSNIRNDRLVNYVLLVPNQKPFFLKSVSTAGIPQTANRVANDIIGIINEIGINKCVSIVTDNAANMRGAWEIIEEAYPKIYCNGCGAHVMNLLIKDICTIPKYAKILD